MDAAKAVAVLAANPGITQEDLFGYHWQNSPLPILLVGTMVAHLYFDTGMFAVVVVSIIWLVTQFTYARSCVRLRETRTLVR